MGSSVINPDGAEYAPAAEVVDVVSDGGSSVITVTLPPLRRAHAAYVRKRKSLTPLETN